VPNPYDSLTKAQRIPAPLSYPALANEILPYGNTFNGGLNVSGANVDADMASEIVTGAGTGGSAHIKLYDNDTTTILSEFMAYDPKYPVGADVTAGDVDGDGKDEIITSPGVGGGPHVRIFKTNGTVVSEFYAYDASFTGGVWVTAGDVDGDGKDEIITSPGVGGGPHVRIFKTNGTVVSEFYAYNPSFNGGIDVSSGDVTGSLLDEVVTAPGAGGGPQIIVFNGNGAFLNQFFAYDQMFTGGVKLSVGNVRTNTVKSEIVTVPSQSGGPNIRMFDSAGTSLKNSMFMEEWWFGYNDVMAGYNNNIKAATGTNRRASLKTVQ
jgi:fibronectin-binding autotransporter adhesin